MFELVWPAEAYLPGYVDALRRGWSSNTMRPEAALEELARVEADAAAFVRGKVDREAAGGPIALPDGTQAKRLPGVALWMWDGEFCGAISLRWQPGTTVLPPHVLGHVGYSVVPWKRRRGYATRALALLLPVARAEGLREYVELTTDPGNIASQRVIEANGGVLVERFNRPASMGGTETLRYRVALG